MKTTTKTFLTAFCILGSALTANAQFKIHSNGNMSFMRSASGLPKSPISLANGGATGDSKYFMSYYGEYNGLYFVADEADGISNKCYGGNFLCMGSGDEMLIGLKGASYNRSSSLVSSEPASIGLLGECTTNSSGSYGYGVLGRAFGSYNGSAVCGIANGNSLSSVIPDDKYAGLFVGKTKVVGNLAVTGTVNGVTISPTPSGRGETEVRSTGDDVLSNKIMSLSTLSFHFPQAEVGDGAEQTYSMPDQATIEEMKRYGIDPEKFEKTEPDVLSEQVQAKKHYALSADELEEVFPDLVYTDKNGEKSINYVEMVPLLVQCINELNARLSALDGTTVGADPVSARTRASLPGTSEIDGTTSKTRAVLYQNTPNPFTAQTEIRFSLPDDAPQAYIYIFDMTGKMQKQISVDASMQSVTINGYELSAGIYLYSLVVGGQEIDTKRMILSK